MEFLQKMSISLNNETEERKLVDAKLTPINHILIPPYIFKPISNVEITLKWTGNLRLVREKQERSTACSKLLKCNDAVSGKTEVQSRRM